MKPAPIAFAGKIRAAQAPDHPRIAEIAGWIAVFVYRTVEADARAEVSGLVVEERFRSQRVGEHLLARAEDWARENGCQAIGLRSNVIRGRAPRSYGRPGSSPGK